MIDILPQSMAKVRILEAVLFEPGINITGIIRKTKVSPNLVVKYSNALVKEGVLREQAVGGARKKHVRLLYPKLEGLGVKIFSLVEVERRERFLKKYPRFRPLLSQMAELFEGEKVEFALIYGSFARLAASGESDVDMLVVGKADISGRLSDILVTLGREYSVRIEGRGKFLENLRKAHYRGMLKEHILIFGESEFLSAVKGFYGPSSSGKGWGIE